MEGKVIKFCGCLKSSGTGERGGETRDSAEVLEISRINLEVAVQILTTREDLILSDPLGATEQSVVTANLASVIRWLEFANSSKVLKHPSFYVRVLNRLEELRPDLFEKLRDMVNVNAVQKSTLEWVEKNAPESK